MATFWHSISYMKFLVLLNFRAVPLAVDLISVDEVSVVGMSTDRDRHAYCSSFPAGYKAFVKFIELECIPVQNMQGLWTV
jgi:hypothetical protein